MKVIEASFLCLVIIYKKHLLSKRKKKMALNYHKKINSIICVWGYVGTYHACDNVIN